MMPRVLTWTAVLVALGSGGCAYFSNKPSTTDRLPDGTIRIKCPTSSLALCLTRAEEACAGNRFKVLAAVDQHDYMGAQSTPGGGFESRASEAIIQCGKRGKALIGKEDAQLPALAGECSAVAAKPDGRSSACVPGMTQECVGPGACRGGQACLPGGASFAPCDCGPAGAGAAPTPTSDKTPPPAPTAAPVPPPAKASPAPVPAATVPAVGPH